MRLFLGDCLEKLKELPDASVDCVITDPPYGLEFMGKEWDGFGDNQKFQEFNRKWAFECLRVLKSGGFLFAMGGTRTHHRLTCGIEDAGFLIRDELCWVYLQGFPKAQDLGMLVEKKLGGVGEDTGKRNPNERPNCTIENTLYKSGTVGKEITIKLPSISLAKEWIGWKTPALKPAFEPIVVAQKPCEGSITENVMKFGVGGFNIDACRIPYESEKDGWFQKTGIKLFPEKKWNNDFERTSNSLGRFPSNVLMSEPCFDGKEGVVKANDSSAVGHIPKISKGSQEGHIYSGAWGGMVKEEHFFNEGGGFSKFFIIPKASKGEKEEGLTGMPKVFTATMNDGIGGREHNESEKTAYNKNFHPTVKPVLLMEHLIKLVTKQGQVVLDPFLGSGTTGVAALNLNRDFIGMEISEEYFKIAEKRINDVRVQSRLFSYE